MLLYGEHFPIDCHPTHTLSLGLLRGGFAAGNGVMAALACLSSIHHRCVNFRRSKKYSADSRLAAIAGTVS